MPLSGLCIALAFLLSCDDENPVHCPTYEVGAVEGYALSAGVGMAEIVGARTMERPNMGTLVSSVMSDSTGWYRLDLPTGLYRIEVAEQGPTFYPIDPRDTVRVTPNVHRLDLLRGHVVCRVAVPTELDGRLFELHLRDDYRVAGGDTAYSRAGLIEFDVPFVPADTYLLSFSPAPWWTSFGVH